MARKNSESDEAQNPEKIHFPPERIRRLLLALRAAVESAESRELSLDNLERLTGRPAGTIGSWCDGARMHQLEFLFALLERLPQWMRHRVVDDACRVLPTLHHPKLAHDAVALGQLEGLLAQPNGLTLIQGKPDHMRSFLLRALGNSFSQLNFGRRSAVGFDHQGTSFWAPVPGVFYSANRPRLERLWIETKKAEDASLILLGDLGFGKFPAEVVSLAARCHVILAEPVFKPEELAHQSNPLHLVTVSPAREQPEWLRVAVQRV